MFLFRIFIFYFPCLLFSSEFLETADNFKRHALIFEEMGKNATVLYMQELKNLKKAGKVNSEILLRMANAKAKIGDNPSKEFTSAFDLRFGKSGDAYKYENNENKKFLLSIANFYENYFLGAYEGPISIESVLNFCEEASILLTGYSEKIEDWKERALFAKERLKFADEAGVSELILEKFPGCKDVIDNKDTFNREIKAFQLLQDGNYTESIKEYKTVGGDELWIERFYNYALSCIEDENYESAKRTLQEASMFCGLFFSTGMACKAKSALSNLATTLYKIANSTASNLTQAQSIDIQEFEKAAKSLDLALEINSNLLSASELLAFCGLAINNLNALNLLLKLEEECSKSETCEDIFVQSEEILGDVESSDFWTSSNITSIFGRIKSFKIIKNNNSSSICLPDSLANLEVCKELNYLLKNSLENIGNEEFEELKLQVEMAFSLLTAMEVVHNATYAIQSMDRELCLADSSSDLDACDKAVEVAEDSFNLILSSDTQYEQIESQVEEIRDLKLALKGIKDAYSKFLELYDLREEKCKVDTSGCLMCCSKLLDEVKKMAKEIPENDSQGASIEEKIESVELMQEQLQMAIESSSNLRETFKNFADFCMKKPPEDSSICEDLVILAKDQLKNIPDQDSRRKEIDEVVEVMESFASFEKETRDHYLSDNFYEKIPESCINFANEKRAFFHAYRACTLAFTYAHEGQLIVARHLYRTAVKCLDRDNLWSYGDEDWIGMAKRHLIETDRKLLEVAAEIAQSNREDACKEILNLLDVIAGPNSQNQDDISEWNRHYNEAKERIERLSKECNGL